MRLRNDCYITKSNILFSTDTFEIVELDSETVAQIYNDDKVALQKVMEMLDNTLDRDFAKVKGLKILTTNSCNMKCSYCFANNGTYNDIQKEFDEALISKLMTFINDYTSLEYMIFFGGEPLMNIAAIEKICYSALYINPDMKFIVQTNGTIVNQRIVECIKKYNISIVLSIDGPKEIHDKNRVFSNGVGSYEIIKKNYELIGDFVTCIQATYDIESAYTRDETFDYLNSTFSCNNIIVSDVYMDGINIFEEDYGSIEEEFEAIQKQIHLRVNKSLEILHLFFSNQKKDYFCRAGNETLTIHSDGKIFPCHLMISSEEKEQLSHIDNFSVEQYLAGKNAFLKKIDKSKCGDCLAKFVCTNCIANTSGAILDKECKKKVNYVENVLEKLGDIIVNNRLESLIDSIFCLTDEY